MYKLIKFRSIFEGKHRDRIFVSASDGEMFVDDNNKQQYIFEVVIVPHQRGDVSKIRSWNVIKLFCVPNRHREGLPERSREFLS